MQSPPDGGEESDNEEKSELKVRGVNIQFEKDFMHYSIFQYSQFIPIRNLLEDACRGIKFTILFMIAAFLIVGIIAFLYKPTYSVFIKGEQVGYTGDRTKLQHKINDYVENGDGTNKNVAFVQLADLPEYKLCLLKKDIVTNDDEIFNKIKEEGTTYYRYYAIAENEEEKLYVSNFEEAEGVVNTLKEKK